MKKNLHQILTLLLCLILLAVTVCQAKRIEALEQQTEKVNEDAADSRDPQRVFWC